MRGNVLQTISNQKFQLTVPTKMINQHFDEPPPWPVIIVLLMAKFGSIWKLEITIQV